MGECFEPDLKGIPKPEAFDFLIFEVRVYRA